MMPDTPDTPPLPTIGATLYATPPLPSPPIEDAPPTPTAAPRPVSTRPHARGAKSAKQRSYAIARIYCDQHPLIRLEAVAAIALKAIEDGRWTDDEIKKAVDGLARANGRVTVDTLRAQLTGAHGLRVGVAVPYERRPSVSEESVVYVIGSKDARPVKIGTSTNTPQRLGSIQMMCPVILEVFMEHPGEYDMETWLHKKFRRYRLHGEWFDFGELDPVETVRGGIREYERHRMASETSSSPAARRQNQANLRAAIIEMRADR